MVDPTDPDELEQHRTLDGSLDDDGLDVPPGEPLDPDVIEQRQEVPEDDDYDRG